MKPKEHYLSEDNKSFCILPWIHSNIHTTGEVRLCCIDSKFKGVGSIDNNTTWADVWNNEQYRQVRLDMLAGTPVENCVLCYKNEETHGESYRTNSNNSFGRYFEPSVPLTAADGTAPMNIKLLDIRWSNICNFKCRMCSPAFSSLVATELKRTTGQSGLQLEGLSGDTTYVAITDQRPNFIKEIIPHLTNLDGIYFAGGEPMVTPEHYQLLELLIEQGLTKNVGLSYNTNLSRLSYKHWNVLDLWDKFDAKDISLRPSLDSWGSRAEYLRTGTVWSEIEANITTLMRSDRKVIDHLRPTVTVSAWNVLTYTDFMDYMIDRFDFTPDEFGLDPNILYQPYQMSLRTLPPELKQLALDKINDFRNRRSEYTQLTGPMQVIINSLQQTDYDTGLDIVKPFIDNFDKIRGTNFVDTFPELKDWYNGQ